MATKGYLVLRYTGPRGAPGVFEAWNEAANNLMAPGMERWKAAGGTRWWITHDVFGNSPRVELTLEFATVEQAIAYYVKPTMLETVDNLLKLGTLDFNISVHKLSREG